MPAIFGEASRANYVGAFRTVAGANGKSALSFNGTSLTLMQNLQVSHQQPVQNVFEIGSNNRYYVVGKASGTFSATQILGFGNAALSQVTSLADPCTGDRTLTLNIPNSYCEVQSSGAGGSLFLKMTGVLLQSVGFSVAAQDNLISSQIQGLMTDLEYDVS